MGSRRSLVIDTDTASDDAVALLQALRHPGVDVRAITVVAGNVPLELAVRNALVTLTVAAAEVPVFAGCARPLLRPLETAQFVHGEDGMSGAELPEPRGAAEAQHAVLALLEIAAKEPGQHDLVTLGPLTNIATALTVDPLFLTRFNRTVMMVGAADGIGNVSPAGEFNAWADPEAAAIVFAAPGAKTMVGWDVSRRYAVLNGNREAELRAVGPLGLFASRINQAVLRFATEVSGVDGYDLPDPVAMAVALDERLIVTAEERHMLVSTATDTRGQTFVDRRRPLKPATVRVVTEVDAAGFMDQLFALLREDAA